MTKLSGDDREWIRMVAQEFVSEAFEKAIPLHVAACPHGLKLVKLKWMCIGVGIGIPMATAGLVAAAMKLLPALVAAL